MIWNSVKRDFKIWEIDLIRLLLTLPQGRNSFTVYCDALRIGLGCVLMQNEKIVAYTSRKLKIHEKNYPTLYLDLEAVIYALKI